MSFIDNLDRVLRRHDELRDMLSGGELSADAFSSTVTQPVRDWGSSMSRSTNCSESPN